MICFIIRMKKKNNKSKFNIPLLLMYLERYTHDSRMFCIFCSSTYIMLNYL